VAAETAETAGTEEEQLAWEARQRPRAAVLGIAAALLTLGAAIFTQMIFADLPRASFVNALSEVAQSGAIDAQQSLKTASFEFYDDHGTSLLSVAAMNALGMLALGGALTFLAYATRARREELPRFALIVPAVGAVLSGLATVLRDIGISTAVDDFLTGPHTVQRAADVSDNSLALAASFIGLVGSVAVAVAFVLVCLNAMRAGLLTRFMGVLGILVGVLTIFPIGSPVPVVQSFWLFALGLLFAGYWPAGIPPAWRTGRQEPWPSQQEIREQRQREMARRRGQAQPEPAPPDDAPEPVAAGAATGRPHPSSRKKKRKRRN
jgi:hypothetical protein